VTVEAIVFDFDGLILDTEEPEFLAWRQVWSEAGQELTLEEWSRAIGTVPEQSGFHPLTELIQRSGRSFDEEQLRDRVRSLNRAGVAARAVSAGALSWAQEARSLGLKVAIASTSELAWIDGHLQRLAVAEWWPVVSCFDDCGTAKPDPASYRLACQKLGVEPGAALAVEDSRNGLLAAKAAGLACVVVPSPMTAHMDFSEADLMLSSLGDFSLTETLVRLGRLESAPSQSVEGR
jgi:beta-phosphoglucomutase-like phosphatase (HAD superfamily)